MAGCQITGSHYVKILTHLRMCIRVAARALAAIQSEYEHNYACGWIRKIWLPGVWQPCKCPRATSTSPHAQWFLMSAPEQ